MGFDTDISDGVAKMRSATILGGIFRPHQRTKNPLNYFHTNSKYGNSVAIRDSDTQETFQRDARDKGWVDEILIHSLGEKEEIKVAMA